MQEHCQSLKTDEAREIKEYSTQNFFTLFFFTLPEMRFLQNLSEIYQHGAVLGQSTVMSSTGHSHCLHASVSQVRSFTNLLCHN